MCLIHKWKYEIIDPIKEGYHRKAIRLCSRCFKKQKTRLGAGIWNFRIGDYVHGWETTEPIKDELRDLKLTKLLKN